MIIPMFSTLFAISIIFFIRQFIQCPGNLVPSIHKLCGSELIKIYYSIL